MSGYWLRFAKTGDPSGAVAVTWPPYEKASDLLLEFGNDGIAVRKGFRSKQLNFHDARYKKKIGTN